MMSNDNKITYVETISKINSGSNDELDLRELFNAIWRGKWLIAGTTTLFIVISVIYALNLPNIYKSEVLLAPVSEESGLKVPGELGGLAALAGVNLGNKGGDKTNLALEIIKSREFLGRFIEQNNLLVPVMAAKGWNQSDDSLVFDSALFDAANDEWVRVVQPPYKAKPSLLEAHEKFLELLSVLKDKESGMIKISLEHVSPYFAQQWLTLLVKSINNEMRQRELTEAQNSISYLTKQLEITNIADVRAMLFSLIEEQTKTVMLANVRQEYVFKTVDPAVVAEKRSKPARALIIVLSAMLGVMLSILIVLVRYFSNKI